MFSNCTNSSFSSSNIYSNTLTTINSKYYAKDSKETTDTEDPAVSSWSDKPINSIDNELIVGGFNIIPYCFIFIMVLMIAILLVIMKKNKKIIIRHRD